jgi:hypothetical protein
VHLTEIAPSLAKKNMVGLKNIFTVISIFPYGLCDFFFNFKEVFIAYFSLLRPHKMLCPNLYIVIGKGRVLLKECYFSTVY